MRRFEEIPHTADWSFRAFGKDLRELFENAAFAMFSLEGMRETFRARDASRERARKIEVNGIDYESLIVNWLTELLWLQESNRETYHRFEIDSLSQTELRAQVFGAPYETLDKIIKAVTYHNLKIEQTSEGWQVTVVVDV
ncbi:MAG: archease [Chloroflexi bacterium]|nr:archease [Chloroflexota bacterium]